MNRYNPDPNCGLTNDEVTIRKSEKLINCDTQIQTKTVRQIVADNFFTLFNILNFIIATALFAVGSYHNTLFCGVVLCNLIIGIFQEVRAKITTDKLSLISQTSSIVIRNGKKEKIQNNEIVLDDIVVLARGDCLSCDCILSSGLCEVNEALITGESDPIAKGIGDMLLSGSFIVSGSCCAKAENIGDNHYSSKISKGAKYIKKPNSQIMKSLNVIIKTITFAIIPIGILFFFNQYTLVGGNLKNAVETTSASIIGMIPEGLILLVSTVLAVSIVRLSKKKVLVQELYCIETLARVDTLCLDKTGTITEGIMELDQVIYISPKEDVDNIITLFATLATDSNPTFDAILKKYPPDSTIKNITHNFTPFSSARKYSALEIGGKKYFLGAGDILCPEKIKFYTDKIIKGRRVLTICEGGLPLALIVIKDKVKKSAKTTLEYFRKQGVDIKIISGDAAETVAEVANEAGVISSEKYIDMTNLTSELDYIDAARKYTVFGRVTPDGKEKLIKALQKNLHTVAMTGDGVNDVLALKAADCSIAMANGSAAARNVSHLILLNSDFSALPDVVYEGRRSINNIRRSASLFLVKTIFTAILSLIYLFINLPYPFIPIQLTLISTMTIGIPSFILALEPSKERINGNFTFDILKSAFPTALSVIINIIILTILCVNGTFTTSEMSTIATIVTGFAGLYLLLKLCLPFNPIRISLFSLMTAGFFGGSILLQNFFEFSPPTIPMLCTMLALCAFAIIIFELTQKIIKSIDNRIIR